ncbi:MAG: MBL fold metallo-hydrolase [Sphingobacteriaceae bacterium]|nr:MAG: MBL fold metallo-hydrolase [Sphingobacteriaceae bacterium]
MRISPLKRILTLFVLMVLLTTTTRCGFVASLGRKPHGDALARLDTMPNYKNGAFRNLPNFERDTFSRPTNSTIARRRRGALGMLKSMMNRPKQTKPVMRVPSVETDLKVQAGDKPTVVWFGHSSVLIKTKQGNILIDPIFSGNAGPLPFFMKAFKGTTDYNVKDLPPIDVLIISHDHYDHLDYRTVRKLRKRVKMVVVPVGVGSHFRYWGYDPKKITELNWHQSVQLPDGIQITATPAHHRSNRTLEQNKTLWASYVINADSYQLFYSGDGGYGSHFKDIGKRYGPFDLALMECGQYNPNWSQSHMHPTQTAQAAVDLQARIMQPVHWAKFAEAYHPWSDPVRLLLPTAEKLGVNVSIPRIGEPYTLGESAKKEVWWNFE